MHAEARTSQETPEAVLGLRDRARWAELFRRRIAARGSELAEAVRADVGKSAWEVSSQELMPLAASLRWHGRHAARLLRPRRVASGPWWMLGQRHWVHRLPVGRVLVIATWNYPIQLAGIQLAQSVIAGNRTVLKPSERSPRSQRLLVALAREALVDAGMPDSMVECADHSREAGEALVASGRFDHVVFTGSTAVGRLVAAACARSLTPSTLELSGRDSAIVLADADPRLAARSIWMAVSMNAGQTCMAPRRALVDRAVYARFLEELRPLVEASPAVRLADAAMAERCVALSAAAVAAGGRPLADAPRAASEGAMRPACVVDCPERCELAAGDHFGPALAVIPVDGMGEALRVHRDAGQHLATAVFTGRPLSVGRDPALLAALGSGVVTVNDAVLPTAHPGTSIVGRASSGWGASRGPSGLLALTREVCVSETSPRMRPPAEEPGPAVQRFLRRFAIGAAGKAPRASRARAHPGAPRTGH